MFTNGFSHSQQLQAIRQQELNNSALLLALSPIRNPLPMLSFIFVPRKTAIY